MSESYNDMICVSYCPMLLGDPYKEFWKSYKSDPGRLITLIPEYDADAIACIWVSKDGVVSPVLVYNDAPKIVDHLLEWSKNKPTDWFKILIFVKNNQYALLLLPLTHKAADEFKISAIMDGVKITHKTEIDVITRPLQFISSNDKSSLPIKDLDKIQNSAHLGFISISDVVDNKILDSIIWMGEYGVEVNAPSASAYVDALFGQR